MLMLRSQPYRLFFPLGAILGGIGVSHWLLYSLGLQESYSGQVHALIQLQAFLTAFACGFLLTMVPRRTQTAPATWVEMATLCVGLVCATFGPLRGAWVVAEGGFLLTLLTMAQFAVRRFLSGGAGRRPPDSFVLIPVGLLHGVAGAALILFATVNKDALWAMQIGRGYIQEGMFLCLTLGIGHMILPMLTGYDVPADADAGAAGRRVRLTYVVSGLLILASFPLHYLWKTHGDAVVAMRVAYGLRTAVAAYHIVFGMRAYRRPRQRGIQRWFVWVSFWCVPTGLALVTLFPAYYLPMLHVMFIGGFGLMTFSVGCHVILSHGEFPELAAGRPWPVVAFGICSFTAMLTRVSADFVSSYFLHLGVASAIWLVALLFWVVFLVPKVLVIDSSPPA